MILFVLSADTRLNENSLLILNFFLCCFYTWVKCKFLIMELIVSFPENIEVSLSQLKRFNGSVIDLKGLLKVEWHPFVLITIYHFQATFYFLVYCYFCLRTMVYMLSKMVWNYNQHLVSQGTGIWLVYSHLPPGFVVT